MDKPDFRVYKHNTTKDWHADIVAIGGIMYDVYIFDSNIHVYACELAPSYEMRYIGPTWSGNPAHADDSEEQREDFFDLVNDNCNETSEVLYIHSRGFDLESCEKIDIDDKRWKSLIEDSDGDEEQAWKTAYSEVSEYCQGNGYTF